MSSQDPPFVACDIHSPEDASHLLDTALRLYQDCAFKDAIDLLEHLRVSHLDVLPSVTALAYLGICYHYEGDFHAALSHLLSSYAGIDESVEASMRMTIISYLAQTYKEMDDPEKAVGFFEEAEQYWRGYEADEWKHGRAIFRLEKGRCYQELGDYSKALAEFEQYVAMHAGEEPGDDYDLTCAVADSEIGNSYLMLGQHPKARVHLKNVNLDVLPRLQQIEVILDRVRLYAELQEFAKVLVEAQNVESHELSDSELATVCHLCGVSQFGLGSSVEARHSFEQAAATSAASEAVIRASREYLERLE